MSRPRNRSAAADGPHQEQLSPLGTVLPGEDNGLRRPDGKLGATDPLTLPEADEGIQLHCAVRATPPAAQIPPLPGWLIPLSWPP